jgi:dolichol-phosphate mannosyltransferase
VTDARDVLREEVPAFRADVWKARASEICVAVFVINEGERIRAQVAEMRELASTIDIVIADGGSTDGSLDPDYLIDNGIRALLTKTGPGKLSAQMRMVFAWTRVEGYSGVVVIDGNGKDNVDAIPDFVKLLEQGYDHIQGSRFIPGGHAVNTPLSRLLGVRLLHSPLISLASRVRQTDTTNGFRGYSMRLITDPEVSVFRSVFATYELHYHLAIEAGRMKRFRTVETPVTRAYPASGEVPTKISPVKGNLRVLGILFKAVAGRYKVPKKQVEQAS